MRHAVNHLPRIFHQSHAPVFLAHNQINVTVLVPVQRYRHDHAQVHLDRFAHISQILARGILRTGARSDVFEPGEFIDELAAYQVQVAVAVEIGKIRGRHTIDVHRLSGCRYLLSFTILRLPGGACIADQVHVSVQRAARPPALVVEGIIPAVVVPVANADYQVKIAVPVIVTILPLVGADAAFGVVHVS